ncbi:hypothetical protein [Amycolatopsis sp. NPDC051128]|uniref:hypothetical protein n=1 Tax=Amycolatopsis sp. NPDC051128 TaxID=3155412 RepID=UPI00342B831B
MSRLSLRARLLLLTAGLLLAGLALGGAVVSDQVERYQLDRLDGRLRSLTELISRVSATGPPRLENTSARPELLDPALELFGTPYLVYLDAGGTPAARRRAASTPRGWTAPHCRPSTRCARCPPTGPR